MERREARAVVGSTDSLLPCALGIRTLLKLNTTFSFIFLLPGTVCGYS